MGLNNCCLKYTHSVQPKNELKDVFTEELVCPTCKKALKVTFQEISTMGEGLSEYQVIGVDPIEN